MSYWDYTLVKKKMRFHAFFVVTAILVLTILLADTGQFLRFPFREALFAPYLRSLGSTACRALRVTRHGLC